MREAPTKEERAAACRVLAYYLPQASAIAERTDQEKSSEWARSLEVCRDLLAGDPVETMNEYLAEWEAGR